MSATTKFKSGDPVWIADGTQGYYGHDLGGKTGVVEDWPKTPRNHTLVRLYDTNRFVPTEALTLIAPPEEPGLSLTDALDKIKKGHGLCEEFDRITDLMLDEDPLPRLAYAAEHEGYDYLVPELKDLMKPKPVYVRPATPALGDYIKVTFKDGQTHTGEVTNVREASSSFQGFYLGLRWAIILPDADSTYWNLEPGNAVVSIEHIEPPKKDWKVGDTVPAYTRVGRKWLGEGTDSTAGRENSPYYTTDRKIVWLDESPGIEEEN